MKPYVCSKLCTQMFTAELLATVKKGKQLRFPSLRKWIKGYYLIFTNPLPMEQTTFCPQLAMGFHGKNLSICVFLSSLTFYCPFFPRSCILKIVRERKGGKEGKREEEREREEEEGKEKEMEMFLLKVQSL